MEVLSYNNINTLNSKYNVIKPIDGLNFSMEQIINRMPNQMTINLMYNVLYLQHLKGLLNPNDFLNELKKIIQNVFNDRNYNKDIFVMENTLNTIQLYISFFDHNKITVNGRTMSNNVHNICAHTLLNNMTEDFVIHYVKSLISSNDNILENTKILSKYLVNDDNQYLNEFYEKISNQLNHQLEVQFKKYNDIHYIFNKITEVVDFLNNLFEKSDIFYKKCYPKWCDFLINCIQMDYMNELPFIIGHLQNIEPYIGNDEIALKIATNVINIIELLTVHKLCVMDANTYIYLSNIATICELLFNGWGKYEVLYDNIMNKVNDIYKEKIIDFIHDKIKSMIESFNDLNNANNEVDIASQIKIDLMVLSLTLRTKNADRSIMTYITYMQKRYIELKTTDDNDCCTNIQNVYNIDQIIIEHILTFVENNNKFAYLINYIDKLKNTVKDIEISLKMNQEINSINVKYVDENGNELLNPNEKNTAINYFMINNLSTWNNYSQEMTNAYASKYNGKLQYILNTFTAYYSKKCPIRKIKILNNLSTLVLNYKLGKIEYKIKTTLAQANILMMFLDNSSLSLSTICNQIDNNTDELIVQEINKICNSLIDAKLIIFNEETKEYELNKKLKMLKKHRTMPANIAKFYFKNNMPQIPAKEIVESIVEFDRENTVKCYIIKCVKQDTNKIYSTSEIVDYVSTKLTYFTPTKEDYDKAFYTLEKLYYIDKSEQGYKYEAE